MGELLLVVLEHCFLLFFGHSINYVSLLELIFAILHTFGDRKGLFVGVFMLLLLLSNHVVVVIVVVLQLRLNLVGNSFLLKFGIA
jgi:hypothetical protein